MCGDHKDNYNGSVKLFATSIRNPEARADLTFEVTGARYDHAERGWFVKAVSQPEAETGTFFVIWEDGGYRVCYPMPHER